MTRSFGAIHTPYGYIGLNTSDYLAWQIDFASEFVQSASAGETVLEDDPYAWSQEGDECADLGFSPDSKARLTPATRDHVLDRGDVNEAVWLMPFEECIAKGGEAFGIHGASSVNKMLS